MRRSERWFRVAILFAVTSVASTGFGSEGDPAVLGLDHIPVAVADLDVAAEVYERLGFVLKPGQPHDNGILNRHVKFPDGTEIELITVGEAGDPLAEEYLSFLEGGDGPAFVAFYAPDLAKVASALEAKYERGDEKITLPKGDPLRYIFFGGRNASPTDSPEHFRHPNGAEALTGFWIAGDHLGRERDLLARMGAKFSQREFWLPNRTRAIVADLSGAEVLFLPASLQLAPGRKIVGATLRTRDLGLVRRIVAENFQDETAILDSPGRVVLPPSLTHGLWIEFREAEETE